MTIIETYKGYRMYRTGSGEFEFWKNNASETDIARVCTATKIAGDAKAYLDKLVSTKQINKFYTNGR